MFRFLLVGSFVLASVASATADEQDQEVAIVKAVAKSKECEEGAVVSELPEPFDRWLNLTCSSSGQLILGRTVRRGEQFVARRSIAPMNIFEEMNPQTRSDLIAEHGMQAARFMGFDGAQIPEEEASQFKVVFDSLFESYQVTDNEEVWLLHIVGQTEERVSQLVLLIQDSALRYAIHMRGRPEDTGVYMTIDADEWKGRANARIQELKDIAEPDKAGR